MSYRDTKLEGPLTRRQTEVMWLVAEGLANKQIADKLHLSEHTVRFHLIVSLKKLGATTRTAAAVRFVLESVPQLPMPHVVLLRALSAPV